MGCGIGQQVIEAAVASHEMGTTEREEELKRTGSKEEWTGDEGERRGERGRGRRAPCKHSVKR